MRSSVKQPLTTLQQEIARTTAGPVLVSAAAGSGKTTVLAERCAYLVCDAPGDCRCDIDRMLVLTFTEEAALQMKHRIGRAIRERIAQRPHDHGFLRQMFLLDQAHISTIHAFCLWLVRQFFARLELDANVNVLDADEAELMLEEATRRVFQARQNAGGAKTQDFRRLLQHYAEAGDEPMARTLVSVYHFMRSLHDADDWITRARSRLAPSATEIRQQECRGLLHELACQTARVSSMIEYVEQQLQVAYADEMSRYLEALKDWHGRLASHPDGYESLAQAIRPFVLSVHAAARKKATDEQRRAKEQASLAFKQIKRWHEQRLVKRYTLFGISEWSEGLHRVKPYADTLFELLAELDTDYEGAKRRRQALDFSDLEHLAYRLLARDGSASEVAQTVRARFRHVLVDEFQDINPIQDQILQLASREETPGVASNLFCVGDVKQSIYRFRMAEPEILLSRRRALLSSANRDGVKSLPTNFRSQPSLIEGLNHIFGRLMVAPLAGIQYSEEALQFSRQTPAEPHPIELHLVGGPASNSDEPDPSERWTQIERQALVVGRRIHQLVEEEGRRYGDIAVLLRAANLRIEQIAGVLMRLGIPTRADATTGFFGAMEVSDMLALLSVLDNMQQDIPLAAVMRSGVCGIRFNESELLIIRQSFLQEPFAAAVLKYSATAEQTELHQRLRSFQECLSGFRRLTRRGNLPEALWQIYMETGYLAAVCTRPGGAQRRANLLMLHRRAQQFSGFGRHQTLYEFLDFLDQLRKKEKDLSPAATEPTDDVVRVMTIHNSKGLEFPVVFVANLEKRFNRTDLGGSVIYDRAEGLGLLVADAKRRIRYPSLAYLRVRDQLGRHLLAEELRILYVALTRAEDRLILVGSADLEEALRFRQGTFCLPAELTVAEANSYLDWLLPTIAAVEPSRIQWSNDPREATQGGKLFHVIPHSTVTAVSTQNKDQMQPADRRRREACAELATLPDQEPVDVDHAALGGVFERLDFRYPHRSLGSIPSVVNMSEFKRRVNLWAEDEHLAQRGRPFSPVSPVFLRESEALSPAERGTVTHLFLQHLDYARPQELEEQLRCMISDGSLSEREARSVDLEAIAWFLSTDLGKRAGATADRLHREVVVTAKADANQYEPHAHSGGAEDFILLRGMVDLLLPESEGFEVVDFKTDRLSASDVAERAAVYQDQVQRYAKAIADIWRCPVPRGYLVFLSAREICCIEC